MAIPINYRTMTAQLTAGVQVARAFFGERLLGVQALVFDLLAEGARQSLFQHMPGHPQQAPDSVSQSGSDAGLFRYRGETDASWKSRVANPWPEHEQSGTDINLLREIDEWGGIVYPATWVAGQCYLLESSGGRFTLFIPAGLVPWGPKPKFGSGKRFGDGTLYGVTASGEDVATLRRIVRKWKPSRSKASAVIIVSGVVYGERGVTFGSGKKFGANTLRISF